MGPRSEASSTRLKPEARTALEPKLSLGQGVLSYRIILPKSADAPILATDLPKLARLLPISRNVRTHILEGSTPQKHDLATQYRLTYRTGRIGSQSLGMKQNRPRKPNISTRNALVGFGSRGLSALSERLTKNAAIGYQGAPRSARAPSVVRPAPLGSRRAPSRRCKTGTRPP